MENNLVRIFLQMHIYDKLIDYVPSYQMGRFDTFFLVPKLAPSFEFWSMSFHHLEIEIIKKNPNSKIIIKLLKVDTKNLLGFDNYRDNFRCFEIPIGNLKTSKAMPLKPL